MKTSYKNFFEFANAGNVYLQNNKKETHLTVSIVQVLSQYLAAKSEFEKKGVKIKRRNAAVDEYGCILKDDKGSYRYTKEGEEAMEDEMDALFLDRNEFEYEPDFIKDVPPKLEKEFIEHFTGFVIEPVLTPAKTLIKRIGEKVNN